MLFALALIFVFLLALALILLPGLIKKKPNEKVYLFQKGEVKELTKKYSYHYPFFYSDLLRCEDDVMSLDITDSKGITTTYKLKIEDVKTYFENKNLILSKLKEGTSPSVNLLGVTLIQP